MDAQPTSLIARMFDDLEAIEDPRADNARHFLTDILMIAILGVMSGVDDYPGIVEFGHDRLELLKTFLRLPHGIPSVSTFRRVFASLKPSALGEALRRWSANRIFRDAHLIRQPTMLVWGEDDVHIPLERGFRLRDEMPNARLVVFRNCGHLPPQEYPKQFVGMVSEFCQTEEQKAAPLKFKRQRAREQIS